MRRKRSAKRIYEETKTKRGEEKKGEALVAATSAGLEKQIAGKNGGKDLLTVGRHLLHNNMSLFVQ